MDGIQGFPFSINVSENTKIIWAAKREKKTERKKRSMLWNPCEGALNPHPSLGQVYWEGYTSPCRCGIPGGL